VIVTATRPFATARDIVPGALALLLVAAGVVTLVIDRTTAEVVGGIGLIVGFTAAGIVMFGRSKGLPASERTAWRGVSLALVSAACGLVVFAALGEAGPVFGPGDVFFLFGYAVMILSLGRLANSEFRGQAPGLTLVDMAVAAIAAAAIVWDVALEGLVQIEASPLQRLGLSLYPILDVGIIVGLCLVAVRRSSYRFDSRILLIAAAMTIQVAADLVYLNTAVQASTFQEAQPQYWLFLLSPATFLAAAIIVGRPAEKREFPDRDAPLWALIWPYILALTLVPLHVVRVEDLLTGSMEPTDAASERVILYALLLVGVLIVVRQWIAIRHNRSRVETQRRELIASVSHELRTPLTAVVGFLQVLEEDPDAFTPDEQETMMAEVSIQANQMSRTVTDLITLARDGGATMMIRSAEASLSDIVRSATGETSGATLTTDIDDHLLRVDADRLEQAVGQLLLNAGKYGGGRVHLRAGVKGGTLTIEVHDEGAGIPTRYLSSIWNQFDRGPRRLDSTNPGLGIGLAIVRAIAAAHGGTAAYRRSELLGGSCFSIVIPANTRTGAPWIRELSAR
jgi:signal transduction histidine kinase